MSIGDDLGVYLAFPGFNLGLTLDVNFFLDRMPELPDFLTAIYETPGRAPERIQELGAIAYGHPHIQVNVRSAVEDPQPAKILCRSIYEVLGSVRNTTINGKRYMRLDMIQEPFVFGADENRRFTYTFNVEAFKDE